MKQEAQLQPPDGSEQRELSRKTITRKEMKDKGSFSSRSILLQCRGNYNNEEEMYEEHVFHVTSSMSWCPFAPPLAGRQCLSLGKGDRTGTVSR